MKILHVIPSIDPATGGPVEGLRQLCSIYRAGGHEIEVASVDPPALAQSIPFPAQVHALGPGMGVYGYTRHALPWFRANLTRYDVVFIDCIWQYNAVAAYRVLARAGVPYGVFTHGMLDPYFKRHFPLKHLKKTIYWHAISQRILHHAAAVLFTCEEEKILARQSFSRYHVREAVVPFGTFGPNCDTNAAAREFLDRWPQLRGRKLAITLGRIHPKKGTDLLIKAFAKTLATAPNWHLVIAGPDQVGWQKDLEALAAKLGVAERIAWTGMLRGTLKWGAFAASEVFVLPSHQENFGIVVAEALACGLPVILSDKVNIWREIDSCGAGFVGGDTEQATTASLRRWMVLKSEEAAAMRLGAQDCFQRFFNFDVSSSRVLEVVDAIAHYRKTQ